jgi:hypothetical protein
MLEEKLIKEDDDVFLIADLVGPHRITVSVTGLEAVSTAFPLNSITAKVSCLQFGKVVP